MALLQRTTARWKARVIYCLTALWMFVLETLQAFLNFKARVIYCLTALWMFVLETLQAFLNFKEGESVWAKFTKLVGFVSDKAIYIASDYLLFILSGVLVATMKEYDVSFFWTFMALWVFDYVCAGYFVYHHERTGNDLSFGTAFRRAVNVMHKKSRLLGYAGMVIALLQSIYWSGPEQIIAYFREELGTRLNIGLVLVLLLVLTAMQAIIWTYIFGSGYDLVVKYF